MDIVDARDGWGSFKFTQAVTSQPRDLAIARGLIPGCKTLTAFGERTTAGAETNFPIWNDGNFVLPPPAGVQLSIVSTSANDTNITGSGAWTLKINYLDAQLAEKIEIVALNGLTPVTTVATNIRFVQRMNIESGAIVATGLTAAGTITVTYNAGTVASKIDAGRTSNNSAFKMVPAGYTLRIGGLVVGSASSTADTVSVIRPRANYMGGKIYESPLIFFTQSEYAMSNSSVSVDMPPQELYPAGTVVGAVHSTDKAATITCSWFGYLEPAL